MASDHFIVRIYRRDMKQPDHLVGQVEDIDLGRRQPFQSMEKLWRILVGKKAGQKPRQTKNQSTEGRSSP